MDRMAETKTLANRPRTRRRGAALENALLDAAWDELVEVGFARLTMESVATRASTGVAVLYRRWPRKDDLVFAAIRHYGANNRVLNPDTGSLRGDLLELLDSINEGRTGFATIMIAAFAGLQSSSGLTPAEVRVRLLADGPLRSDEVFRRADARGELNLDTIPPAVLTLPFELMRHDLLMTLKPIPRERIISIVDDLFLPLAARSVSPASATKP
jgi:AcrR family transcriptional regulator